MTARRHLLAGTVLSALTAIAGTQAVAAASEIAAYRVAQAAPEKKPEAPAAAPAAPTPPAPPAAAPARPAPPAAAPPRPAAPPPQAPPPAPPPPRPQAAPPQPPAPPPAAAPQRPAAPPTAAPQRPDARPERPQMQRPEQRPEPRSEQRQERREERQEPRQEQRPQRKEQRPEQRQEQRQEPRQDQRPAPRSEERRGEPPRPPAPAASNPPSAPPAAQPRPNAAPPSPPAPQQAPAPAAPQPAAPAAQRPGAPTPPAATPPAAPGPQQRSGPPPRSLDQLRGERQQRTEGNRTIIREDDRTIVRDNNRTFIRHDENARFRTVAPNARQERRGNDTVTIINRPGGVQIFSVTGQNGDLVRRYRRDSRGREVTIIDNRMRGPRSGMFVTLPPPLIRIPRDRYIVDAEDANEALFFDTLIAGPVAAPPRRYTLDQIRYSPDVRAYMPRIDVDTVNFDSGSWDITPDQIQRLAPIAGAMNRAIERSPNEVFLIEGHTDATGNDVDNLSLSDRRASSVAIALTEQFGVPPENLTTQGYGSQQLKIPTDGSERRNRRVTIRRITPLLAQGDAPPPPRR